MKAFTQLILFLMILFSGTVFRIGFFYLKVTSFNWASFHSVFELILILAKEGFNWLRRTLSRLTDSHGTCSIQKKEIASFFYNIAFLTRSAPVCKDNRKCFSVFGGTLARYATKLVVLHSDVADVNV